MTNSNLLIKKIGIGTSSYGSKISIKDSIKILECLIDNGLDYIDTSPYYGLGESEKIIGIVTCKLRRQLSLSTKFGISPIFKNSNYKLVPIIKKVYYIPGIKNVINRIINYKNNKILSIENINNSISNSLINLKTTYIDHLFIHNNIDKYISDNEIIDFLLELKEKKIINNLGITTDNISHNNLYNRSFSTLQIPYSNINDFNNNNYLYNYYSIFSNGNVNKEKLINDINKRDSKFIIQFTNFTNIKNNLDYFLC